MSAATIHPDIQAAARAHLLALALPSVANLYPAPNSRWLRSGGGVDFVSQGFRNGDYVVTTGASNAAYNYRARIKEMGANYLLLDPPHPGADVSVLATGAVEMPQVHWEGDTFQPTVGVPFIEEQLKPLDDKVYGMGGGLIRHTANVMLSLKFPSGLGNYAISSMAGRLVHHFRPTTPLIYGTAKALVLQTKRLPILPAPDWLTCPVQITVQAWTGN